MGDGPFLPGLGVAVDTARSSADMPSTVAEMKSGSTASRGASVSSSSVDESDSSRSPKGFESESLSDAVASGSESVANSESPSVVVVSLSSNEASFERAYWRPFEKFSVCGCGIVATRY